MKDKERRMLERLQSGGHLGVLALIRLAELVGFRTKRAKNGHLIMDDGSKDPIIIPMSPTQTTVSDGVEAKVKKRILEKLKK